METLRIENGPKVVSGTHDNVALLSYKAGGAVIYIVIRQFSDGIWWIVGLPTSNAKLAQANYSNAVAGY